MGVENMRTDTAQRILWYALVFIALTIVLFVFAGIGIALAFTYIDIGSFITDPTALAFIEAYPLLIPIVVWSLAVLGIIYFAIIYSWRKNPMAHRTGLTIVGILNLLVGAIIPGLFIILPGLLLEEQ
jgi:hypothetical protein